MTSADSERYGLRPRLATLTAMRPPGSSFAHALGEHVVEQLEVLDVRAGTPPAPSSSSYCLPAKYGGDVTTRATESSGMSSRSRMSPWMHGSSMSNRGATVVVVGELGRLEPGVEGRARRGPPACRRRSSTCRSASAGSSRMRPTLRRGCDSDAALTAVGEAEVGPDLLGGPGEVQRVEVQAGGAAGEQPLAEARCTISTASSRTAGGLPSTWSSRRSRLGGDRGAPLMAEKRRACSTLTKAKTPGQHRRVDAEGGELVDHAEVVVGVEEELRDAEVGHPQLGGEVAGGRWPCRASAGGARGRRPRRSQKSPISLGEVDQLGGVGEVGRVRRRRPRAGRRRGRGGSRCPASR